MVAPLQACCELLSAIEGFREAVAYGNGDETAEVFTMADEDTIMRHISDGLRDVVGSQSTEANEGHSRELCRRAGVS